VFSRLTGAVRYYFPDQAGLLSFAMDLVSRRVYERISAIKPKGSPTEIALRYLEEVIPLDDERQAEFEVWLSFLAQARAESGATGLRDHLDPVQDSLRELCMSLLDSLAEAGALLADLALDLEAESLHALIDGLSLHASIQPGHTTATRVREILGRHLEGLLS
jgi:AcrR family transcriptional regulator